MNGISVDYRIKEFYFKDTHFLLNQDSFSLDTTGQTEPVLFCNIKAECSTPEDFDRLIAVIQQLKVRQAAYQKNITYLPAVSEQETQKG